MSIEDIADVITGGLYTGVSGTETSTLSKLGKAGEHITKTVSGEYAREEKEAREKSARAQRRAQEIEARRAIIAQQREARIRRAQILASSTTVGEGTSGVSGSTGSITSQVASNIGNIGVQQNLATIASQENQNAANAASNAALGAAQLSFATTIFSGAGGFKTIFASKVAEAGASS